MVWSLTGLPGGLQNSSIQKPPAHALLLSSNASARPPHPTYCDKIFCSSGVAIRFSASIFSSVRIASIFLLNFSFAPPIPRVSSVIWKLTAPDCLESRENFEKLLRQDERNAHLFTPEEKEPDQTGYTTETVEVCGAFPLRFRQGILCFLCQQTLKVLPAFWWRSIQAKKITCPMM